MMTVRQCLAICVCSVVCMCGSVSAQDDGISPDVPFEDQSTQLTSDELFAINQQGVDHFNAQEYREAIDCFKNAIAIVPDDRTIKNNLLAAYSYLAVDYMNQGDYPNAIILMEDSLRYAPDDINVKRNLAFAYLNQASAEYDKTKNVDTTIFHLTKALTYAPEDETIRKQLSMFLYNKAMEYYGNREYDKARELLNKSLEYNPKQSFSYEVLGDIAFYQHELDQAKQYWTKALENEQTTRVQEKLAKLQKDITVDKELIDYPSDYFDIKYVPGYDLYTGYKIRQLLREAYRKVGADYNFYPKFKIVALLYSEDLFSAFMDGYWVAASYDGKIRLPQETVGVADTRLKALAFHEYTHALIHYYSGNKVPVWLAEGLALYEENKIMPIDCTYIKKQLAKGYVFTIADDLDKQPMGLSFEETRQFYVTAFTMGRYLVERYKLYKMKEVLKHCKDGVTTEEAFKKALFVSMERLEHDWNESLKRHYAS